MNLIDPTAGIQGSPDVIPNAHSGKFDKGPRIMLASTPPRMEHTWRARTSVTINSQSEIEFEVCRIIIKLPGECRGVW